MKLKPGVTMARADDVLRAAETAWSNARGGSFGFYRAYIDAVSHTYTQLRECFAEPDLASGIRGVAFWHLLTLMDADREIEMQPPAALGDYARNFMESKRGKNEAFGREVDDQIRALAKARAEFNALKALAERPGVPLVLDTNVLHTWMRPDQINWPEVLRGWKESERDARLVVPLRVVDELDGQKYGDGPLARSATKAVRFLRQAFAGRAGEAVRIRSGDNTTLEVWAQTEDRGGDADLAILRCAADLDVFHASGARVVTGDLGMQLRAEYMDLQVRVLPDGYRKKKDEGEH
jgi:PIN domain